jgi:hypothetical protein
MAVFEVTHVGTEPCPVSPTSRHVTDLELRGGDGLHQVDVSVARLMLAADDNLVATSTQTGQVADVRKSRCACGYRSVRTVHGSRTDDDMGSVPGYH